MKILVLESHEIFINGLPYGFVEAGHEVLVSGRVTESKLDYLLDQYKPQLILMLGWSSEHSDTRVAIIREHLIDYKAPLIYWATEDPTYYEYFSLPLVKKLQPDFIFSVSQSCVVKYKLEGFAAHRLDFAYSSLLNNHSHQNQPYEISLVANAYPNVFRWQPDHQRLYSLNILLAPLITTHKQVDIWGNDWDKIEPYLNLTIPPNWIHGHLPYLKLASVFKHSHINLGVQNYTEGVTTMRTYEILGSAGFLITSPHSTLSDVFEINKELIISHSPEETLELTKYYLEHDTERNHIRQCAYEAIKDRHTYKHRAMEAITILEREGIL